MKILAIGAHYDDIELNALGTLLRAKKEFGAELYIIICTDGSLAGGTFKRRAEQEKVDKIVGYKKKFELHLSESNLTQNFRLVSSIEKIVDEVEPDYVITHTEDDFHQDHIAVAKAVRAINRFSRFSCICFPSQDPKQPFLSNLYVDISNYFEEKLKILKLYKTQQKKPWLQKETLKARALGVGSAKYTEKFYIRFLKV